MQSSSQIITTNKPTHSCLQAGCPSCHPTNSVRAQKGLLTECWLSVSLFMLAPCGLRGCKNWPTPFPGRMSYKVTKPGLALSYILACFIVLLFIKAPFYVLLVFVAMCSVFWLFWLSYQYLPSDWLERLHWGSLIVARGSSPESPGRRVHVIFLVYCIASLFYYVFVLSPILRDILSYCYGAI